MLLLNDGSSKSLLMLNIPIQVQPKLINFEYSDTCLQVRKSNERQNRKRPRFFFIINFYLNKTSNLYCECIIIMKPEN
jgi:hypothetical protein